MSLPRLPRCRWQLNVVLVKMNRGHNSLWPAMAEAKEDRAPEVRRGPHFMEATRYRTRPL